MIKYDAKMKKLVTKDWQEQFPTFQIWEPAHLIRRHGPLLVGICLEYVGDPNVYRPSAHFHNLCVPFPTISLDLTGFVLSDINMPCKVKVKEHAETYLSFVARIKEDYPYTINADMDFNMLVIATHVYLSGKYGFPGQQSPYSNLVTIAAYLGQLDYALESLDKFKAIISNWPNGCFNIIGSAEKWRNGLMELIANPDKLHENVEEEVVKHKLTAIKDCGLRWPEKPLKLWEI